MTNIEFVKFTKEEIIQIAFSKGFTLPKSFLCSNGTNIVKSYKDLSVDLGQNADGTYFYHISPRGFVTYNRDQQSIVTELDIKLYLRENKINQILNSI